MRIDSPICNLKTCGHCFDGNCIDRNAYDRCEYALTVYGKDIVHVVRCKDCKWWDKKDDAPYGYCMAMKHGFVSSHWEIGIYRTYKGDFYCADGERREEDE